MAVMPVWTIRSDNHVAASIQTTGNDAMLSIKRNFDCTRCLNTLPSGRCMTLLHPPLGRTCDYYRPEDARLSSLPDPRIRDQLLRHADDVREELDAIFPGITREQVAETLMASASRSSTSRGSRSTARRAVAMVAGEIGVECQRCGSEHEASEVSSPDGSHRCPTCGSDEFAPIGVPIRRNVAREDGRRR